MAAAREVERSRIVEEADRTLAVEIGVSVFVVVIAALAERREATVDDVLADKVLVVVLRAGVDAVRDEAALVDLDRVGQMGG